MNSAQSGVVTPSLSLWPPLLLFKLQWLLLVPGREHFVWLALLLLPVQGWLLWKRLGPQAVKQAVPFAVSGILLDQLLEIAGVLEFGPLHVPLYLAVLWLAFGLMLPVLPLHKLTTPLLALAGAILGVAGYGAGALLGAVKFGLHPLAALMLLAACWAGVLPYRRWLLQLEAGTAARSVLLGGLLLMPLESEASTDWVTIGKGRFSVMWFTLYDATLQAPSPDFTFPSSTPFILSLQYRRTISAARIVDATLDQWRQQQLEWEPQWEALLRAAIPAVSEGDTLQLQVAADGSATLLHNDETAAHFSDPDFVTAFAGIWLGERSTYPGFRRQLMGET